MRATHAPHMITAGHMPLLAAFVLASAAIAATLHVPGEYPDIPAAISAATDGDTVLVSPGTYGGPVGFQGKNIVLRSVAGPDQTVINTFWDFHAVMFTGAEDSTAVLEGFTVSNTLYNSHPDAGQDDRDIVEYGGGIYINGSSPTVRNNVIEYSVAGSGAGIAIFSSSAIIEDNEIRYNQTTGQGPYRGGGVYISGVGEDGPTRVVGCRVYANQAQYGAGVYSNASYSEILGNTIEANEYALSGGGIYSYNDSLLACGNLIVGNVADSHGGGIYIWRGSATLIGNVIAENYASSSGGGIYEKSTGTVHLINNTVAMNQTSQGDNHGGGLYT
ncbi:MAG: right-handed parallel beta-helix repeat-containing protein, partial [Candidatus Fermentibacterota bacterium]